MIQSIFKVFQTPRIKTGWRPNLQFMREKDHTHARQIFSFAQTFVLDVYFFECGIFCGLCLAFYCRVFLWFIKSLKIFDTFGEIGFKCTNFPKGYITIFLVDHL